MTGLPIQLGEILIVPEDHYRFGVGPIVLRVDRLLTVIAIADDYGRPAEPWVYVRGAQVGWDGRGEPRQVLLRVSALEHMPRGDADTRPQPPGPGPAAYNGYQG